MGGVRKPLGYPFTSAAPHDRGLIGQVIGHFPLLHVKVVLIYTILPTYYALARLNALGITLGLVEFVVRVLEKVTFRGVEARVRYSRQTIGHRAMRARRLLHLGWVVCVPFEVGMLESLLRCEPFQRIEGEHPQH